MQVRDYRIFYIDPEEDIKDIIELIRNTSASKLALVIHNSLLLLNSPINLKMIKRYAQLYRKDIVFINPDPSVVEKVNQAGFEIFPNLNALEKDLPLKAEAASQEGEEEEKVLAFSSIKKARYLLFFLLSLFLLAYLYFFYPVITVEVTPTIQEARQEVMVQASTELSKIDWERQILPLHKVKVEVEAEAEVEASGSKLIGVSKARGVVRFINENQQDLTIPAGTVVLTDEGIKYLTLQQVVVPKLQIDYLMDVPVGMKAGQAEVKVEALVPGEQGNVGIGKVKKIEGDYERLYVINPEPITGGRDEKLAVVSNEDIEELKDKLLEKLKIGLMTKLYQELGGNYRIVEDAIQYANPQFVLQQEPGTVSEVVRGEGSLTASGYLLRNSELDRLATNLFEKNLQPGYKLLNNVNVEELILAEASDKLYNIKLELLAPVIPEIKREELVNRLQGQDLKTAQAILQEWPEVDTFNISGRTSSIPKLPFAIKVVVLEPDSFKVIKTGG